MAQIEEFCPKIISHSEVKTDKECGVNNISGPPWQARQGRQARFDPCLDFGFHYTIIRNNWSKNFGVEYWTLPGSNSSKTVKNKNFVGLKKSV